LVLQFLLILDAKEQLKSGINIDSTLKGSKIK
jgi:hypothetical protein